MSTGTLLNSSCWILKFFRSTKSAWYRRASPRARSVSSIPISAIESGTATGVAISRKTPDTSHSVTPGPVSIPRKPHPPYHTHITSPEARIASSRVTSTAPVHHRRRPNNPAPPDPSGIGPRTAANTVAIRRSSLSSLEVSSPPSAEDRPASPAAQSALRVASIASSQRVMSATAIAVPSLLARRIVVSASEPSGTPGLADPSANNHNTTCVSSTIT